MLYTFRVNLDSIKTDLLNATVWIPHIDHALKHGDTFQLKEDQLLDCCISSQFLEVTEEYEF